MNEEYSWAMSRYFYQFLTQILFNWCIVLPFHEIFKTIFRLVFIETVLPKMFFTFNIRNLIFIFQPTKQKFRRKSRAFLKSIKNHNPIVYLTVSHIEITNLGRMLKAIGNMSCHSLLMQKV